MSSQPCSSFLPHLEKRKTARPFFRPALLLLAILALAAGLSACRRGAAPEPTPAPTQAPTAIPPTDTPAPTNTPIPTAVPTVPPEPTTVPAEAVAPRVFFRQPTNNAWVPPTFSVIMGAEGVVVEPAGEVHEGAGHMHILIDTDFVPAGEVIPKDEQHLHFGDGSTTAEITLSPGSHTLRLQFADGAHVALEGEAYRDEIIVGVIEDAPARSVRFVTPTDGATVPPDFSVLMAATGLIVEPAGEVHEGAGHMHILIDTDFVPAGEVIPKDEQHLHFGDGSLKTGLTLAPGPHTLRLQFANGAHIALEGNAYRDEITVQVVEGVPAQQVMFVEPTDGATVPQTFSVRMAAAGLIVEPAGQVLREGAGHMHILIDTDFVPAGEVIPSDEQHLHFGKAQLSTELTLTPGTHILRLQMANGAHIAFEGAQYRDEIQITVE